MKVKKRDIERFQKRNPYPIAENEIFNLRKILCERSNFDLFNLENIHLNLSGKDAIKVIDSLIVGMNMHKLLDEFDKMGKKTKNQNSLKMRRATFPVPAWLGDTMLECKFKNCDCGNYHRVEES